MDEEQYSPPLEKHVLDMVVPEIRKLFDDILKYRVDPEGVYYGITLEKLQQQLAAVPVNQIVALDSEYRYERKGHMYDPLLCLCSSLCQVLLHSCTLRLSALCMLPHHSHPYYHNLA